MATVILCLASYTMFAVGALALSSVGGSANATQLLHAPAVSPTYGPNANVVPPPLYPSPNPYRTTYGTPPQSGCVGDTSSQTPVGFYASPASPVASVAQGAPSHDLPDAAHEETGAAEPVIRQDGPE